MVLADALVDADMNSADDDEAGALTDAVLASDEEASLPSVTLRRAHASGTRISAVNVTSARTRDALDRQRDALDRETRTLASARDGPPASEPQLGIRERRTETAYRGPGPPRGAPAPGAQGWLRRSASSASNFAC